MLLWRSKRLPAALALVLDYFALGRVKFINKYFEEEKELLEKATSAESYRTIVENLRNPVQISAVGRPVEESMLILAGPGSGKTTVIVHRCAYLLEVERVPARQILVLCFNPQLSNTPPQTASRPGWKGGKRGHRRHLSRRCHAPRRYFNSGHGGGPR